MGTSEDLRLPPVPVLCMSQAHVGGPIEDPEIGPCMQVADGFLIAVLDQQLLMADVCHDHVQLLAEYLEHLDYVVEEAFLMESKPQILATLEADAIEVWTLIRQ